MLLCRSEWYTAYHALSAGSGARARCRRSSRYQTLVSELFGPPLGSSTPPYVSNASMYDGASALAEAVLMARRVTGRRWHAAVRRPASTTSETVSCYLAGLCEPGKLD